MTDQIAVKPVRVANRNGLHARPASLFVKTASGFLSQIRLRKNDQVVDGKSMIDVLTLAAEEGTELVLEAIGPDAHQAVASLADLLAGEFGEDTDPAEPA